MMSPRTKERLPLRLLGRDVGDEIGLVSPDLSVLGTSATKLPCLTRPSCPRVMVARIRGTTGRPRAPLHQSGARRRAGTPGVCRFGCSAGSRASIHRRYQRLARWREAADTSAGRLRPRTDQSPDGSRCDRSSQSPRGLRCSRAACRPNSRARATSAASPGDESSARPLAEQRARLGRAVRSRSSARSAGVVGRSWDNSITRVLVMG